MLSKEYSDLETVLPKGWDRGMIENDDTRLSKRNYSELCNIISVYSPLSPFSKRHPGRKKALRIFQGMKAKTEERPQQYAFGQDYDSLIRTANDIIANIQKKNIRFNIDAVIDSHTNGIHSYAPAISFLIDKFGNDITGKDILEIGSRSYGIAALDYLASKGANAHSLDKISAERYLVGKSGVHQTIGRWENLDSFFGKSSLDAIYINYMYPSPYEGGPFMDERRHSRRLNAFEHHVARIMHDVLKPDGIYVMRNWGYRHKCEYLYVNRENFKDFDISTYPIESYGDDDGQRINISLNPNGSDRYDGLNVREYPLDPGKKDLYFGRNLIVFKKKCNKYH